HLAGLAFIQGEADGGSIAGKVFSAMLGASEYLNTVNFYQDLDSWDETKPHLHELEKGGSALDDVGRRRRDFEHMNMDRTWDDITGMVGRLKRSSLKTIVLVSGDVHHNFALLGKIGKQPVGELSPLQQRWPQLLQIVSSGAANRVDDSAERILGAGIVFFPRNHFFRGVDLTLA